MRGEEESLQFPRERAGEEDASNREKKTHEESILTSEEGLKPVSAGDR